MTDNQFSLIDSFLQGVEPDYGNIGLKKPVGMKEQFAANEASQIDKAFLNEPGGAHTAAGAFEPKPIRDATTGDSALADAFRTLEAVDQHNEMDAVTDAEIENRVKFLLSLGHSPNRVASYVKKLAGEVRVQRDALKVPASQSNTAETAAMAENVDADYWEPNKFEMLGSAYIEPNFFMNKCTASFDKIKKEGHLHALSVKKIAACEGCQYHNCGSCNLYNRPIVASASELKTVVLAALDQKGIKVTTTLKAALTQLRNGGEKTTQALPYNRNTEKYTIRTAGDKQALVHKEASVEEIGKMVQTGIPIKEVYKTAAAQYGKVSAISAIKRYIAGLRQSKAKIVLAALDCSLLKNKLATGNAIVGESKCASCSYRNGMHCGLTGGTLLSFPGMNRASSKHISHEGVKDGKQVLFEFDLLNTGEDSPIEYNEKETPEELNIELTRTSSIDIED
jgi:hypothetical protein